MTNRTAAQRYARALLDVAVNERADLDQIERDLRGLVDLFRQNPALEKVLLNPAVPVPRKRAAMAEIVSRGKVVSVAAKLLVLVAERDRLALLPDLASAFSDRLLDYRKVVRAEVTTAAPVSSDRAAAIQQRLAQVTGRTVAIQMKVDPSIIGGVVARVGSTVYDGSVTTQLRKMKEKLVESV